MHTFNQCMGLIPWNNLHHECQSPPGPSLYKDQFFCGVPACFIVYQSNTPSQLSAELFFCTQLWGKIRRWLRKWKTGRYAFFVRSASKGLKLFLHRGTFKNGIFYLNVFFYFVMHHHGLDSFKLSGWFPFVHLWHALDQPLRASWCKY